MVFGKRDLVLVKFWKLLQGKSESVFARLLMYVMKKKDLQAPDFFVKICYSNGNDDVSLFINSVLRINLTVMLTMT